ncbi:hypothetical protein O0L34_g14637 [Tuta absoluta]|nr:hypothetical protein O0L34_g14637 [Tuta absoluta]
MDESDDDYWNTSETKEKAFNFDDDVLTPQEILAIGQQKSKDTSSQFATEVTITPAQLPLNSLVSPKVLDLILLAQSGRDPKDYKAETEPSVVVTLKRLALGRSCSLHSHRSLESKTKLLDGAIAIGDGNAVLTVVLFLIQTLNRKLVYELLSSRAVALSHYISYLNSDGRITELADLLAMLGRSPDAAIYQFQHHIRTQGDNVDGLYKKISNLVDNHLNQPGVDAHHCKMASDYVKLLEWQRLTGKPELHNKSALHCLAHCCSNHWNEGAGNMMSPLTLCQRQQISPLQYDWVVLNVHARAGKWDIVESLFTKKGWLGRATVSSHVPIETLLATISELNASKQLLATCVNRVTDSDDRLRLAMMYKIHSVVIETLAKQKDRSALTNYKMTLNPQSEEYILAENTLRNPSIKWKN